MEYYESDKKKSGDAFASLLDILTDPKWKPYAAELSDISSDAKKTCDIFAAEIGQYKMRAANKYFMLAIDEDKEGTHDAAIQHLCLSLNYYGSNDDPAYKEDPASIGRSMALLGDFYKHRGDAYKKNGDNAKANADYQRAVNLFSGDSAGRIAWYEENDSTFKAAQFTPTLQTWSTQASEEYNANHHAVAAYLYEKAAEMGDSRCQTQLGYMNEKGLGIIRDIKKAFALYTKAAAQGHPTAQYDLGLCYHDGKGVKQNYSKAMKWYRKSAAQGDEDAQKNIKKLMNSGENKIRQPFGFLFGVFALLAGATVGNNFFGGLGAAAGAILAAIFLPRITKKIFPFMSLFKSFIAAVIMGVICIILASVFSPGTAQNLINRGMNIVNELTNRSSNTVTVTVTSDALNLRAESSANSDIIKALKKGDVLTVLGDAVDGWLPVHHEGSQGWVSGQYVSWGE